MPSNVSESTPAITSARDIVSYPTKDGSEIFELVHPDSTTCSGRQSLAEARLSPGQKTQRHRHLVSEEIYHILSGHGLMECADRTFPVQAGDSIVIPSSAIHAMHNTGTEPMRFLCCCAPAYRHNDTELVD